MALPRRRRRENPRTAFAQVHHRRHDARWQLQRKWRQLGGQHQEAMSSKTSQGLDRLASQRNHGTGTTGKVCKRLRAAQLRGRLRVCLQIQVGLHRADSLEQSISGSGRTVSLRSCLLVHYGCQSDTVFLAKIGKLTCSGRNLVSRNRKLNVQSRRQHIEGHGCLGGVKPTQ